MIKLIIMSLLLISTPAIASSGADGAAIPVNFILWQLFNVVVAVLIIHIYMKHVLKFSFTEMFKARREGFTQLMEKAEAAKRKAEDTHRELTEKLVALDAEAKTNKDQARQEALELKNKIINDAKDISDRMIKDAQLTTAFELEKAKLNLRTHLLEESINTAQQNIKSQVSEEELNKLQHDFVDKIQVVQ